MPQNLCCFKCNHYFGRYHNAATIQLWLFCKRCKGHCVFEAQDGALVGARFEPKPVLDASELCTPQSTP